MTLPRARQSRRNFEGGPISYYDEIFICRGPLQIGIVGDGSIDTLFGSAWAVLIDYDTSVRRIYQRVGSSWVERTGHSALPSLIGQVAPEEERRISIAFDQAARLVYANERNAFIRVTRWDPVSQQYVQNVGFTGINPCLMMDAIISRFIPDSDVVLFYQSATAQNEVYYRLQRDNYGVANLLFRLDFGGLIFERAQPLSYRYQLLVSSPTGVAAETNQGPAALVSDPYPYRQSLRLRGSGRFDDGLYRLASQVYEHDMALDGEGEFIEGEYEALEVVYEHDMALTGEGEFINSEYRSVLQTYTHTLRLLGAGEFSSGNYPLVATVVAHTMALDGDGEFVGGTYAAA